jgi:hypothetical protein
MDKILYQNNSDQINFLCTNNNRRTMFDYRTRRQIRQYASIMIADGSIEIKKYKAVEFVTYIRGDGFIATSIQKQYDAPA